MLVYLTMVPLQAFTRITEKLFVLGTPSLQPFLKSYWLTPVQLTGQLSRACKYDELERQYKCGARDNYVRIFSFTTDSCKMTSYCRTCVGPIENSPDNLAWPTQRRLWRSLTAHNLRICHCTGWGLAGMWPVASSGSGPPPPTCR